MENGKLQPLISLNQSKHHCYTLSTTCTLFKIPSADGPRTNIENLIRDFTFFFLFFFFVLSFLYSFVLSFIQENKNKHEMKIIIQCKTLKRKTDNANKQYTLKMLTQQLIKKYIEKYSSYFSSHKNSINANKQLISQTKCHENSDTLPV